jgi:hypothetical protein
VSQRPARRDPGPGILETSLVLGLAALLTTAIIVLGGSQLADIIALIVDAASGGD